MGYQTDFVGHLVVQPPLNATEVAVVNGLCDSPYLSPRAGGPRPVDDLEPVIDHVRRNAPRGWSSWSATSDGFLLSYSGGDKANFMVPWLDFLLGTLLTSEADPIELSRGELTRDHVVNGVVVGSRRDNGELYAIVVRDNTIEVELMWPGEPDASHYPRLGYQITIDRVREWARSQTLQWWNDNVGTTE